MDTLTKYRHRIDKIDKKLLDLLAKRFRTAADIGVYKKTHDLPIVNKKREQEIVEKLAKRGKAHRVKRSSIEAIWKAIFKESYRVERR